MASAKEPGNQKVRDQQGLASQGEVFLEKLAVQGYAPDTIHFYELAIKRFRQEFESRGISFAHLDRSAIRSLQDAVGEKTKQNARRYTLYCLRRFIDHLVGAGVVTLPATPARKRTPLDHLRAEYDAYLRQQCGLGESTIYHCRGLMERFIAFHFGGTLGDLKAVTPDDIVAFLGHLKVGSIHHRSKTVPSHLRNFFKFLFWSGKTKRNLANAIPRTAHASTDLPRYLNPDEVQRLLEAVRTSGALSRRNYAMVLLMARLGLRSPEVVAIQLDDIDWRSGEILIRGKGQRQDRMPLPPDVGEAIVDYIRNERAGSSRTLFVSAKVPHPPFNDASILNYLLRDAFRKTGLHPPQKYVGSHVLRHSLAVDMLRRGASLDEIGDVLRHRSRMTTTIYAKYDLDALRSIVQDWPAQGGRQ